MNNIEIRSKISNKVTQVGRRQNLKGIRVQQIVDTGSYEAFIRHRPIDFILIHNCKIYKTNIVCGSKYKLRYHFIKNFRREYSGRKLYYKTTLQCKVSLLNKLPNYDIF